MSFFWYDTDSGHWGPFCVTSLVLQVCPHATTHGNFSIYPRHMCRLLSHFLYFWVTGIVDIAIFIVSSSTCAVYFEMCRQYCILQLILAGLDKLAQMKGYENIRVSYLVGGRAAQPDLGTIGVRAKLVTPDTQIIPGKCALSCLVFHVTPDTLITHGGSALLENAVS